jgi:predicted PurR-regulated permease PerM
MELRRITIDFGSGPAEHFLPVAALKPWHRSPFNDAIGAIHRFGLATPVVLRNDDAVSDLRDDPPWPSRRTSASDSPVAAGGPGGSGGPESRRAGLVEPGRPVPRWLDTGAAWSWRLLLIGLPVIFALWLANYLAVVVIPVVISLFVAALLEPVRRSAAKYTSTAWASVAASLVGLLFFGTVLGLAAAEISSNFNELVSQTQDGISRITNWLDKGPLNIDADRLDQAITEGLENFRNKPGQVVSGAASVLATGGGLLAGLLLVFVTTVFFMFDRSRMVDGTLAAFPEHARRDARQVCQASWQALVSYAQVTLLEATFDSVLIGGAAAIAGVPVAFALGSIVFLSVFVPTLGAIVSGALVTLVAYVTQGPWVGLFVGATVIVVQQVDANILYPILTSRRLSIHPLTSILLVIVGGIIGGIFGAFVAVPVAGMIVAGFRELRRIRNEDELLAPLRPELGAGG